MSNINIKITAEVDGKQVPLNTISTETFEAIKALEKPKHVWKAGDVAEVSGSWRLIIYCDCRLQGVNVFGTIQGGGTQEYFERNHYKFVGRQQDLLNQS